MNIEQFLTTPGIIVDVRSPLEFAKGHIPGALNLPLFTDEERAIVGTLYKQKGKDVAIEAGLQFAGPKLGNFVSFIKENVKVHCAKVHCARGGLRSSSMAWLFNTAGVPAITLKGGYKAFRRFILSTFSSPFPLKVLGGLTGSGKTECLQELKKLGEQVLDLEHLASHKGSSFGNLGLAPQPTTEQFENALGFVLHRVDKSRPLWVEDESRMIGKCKIPDPFFHQIRSSPLYYLDCPENARVERLLKEYGELDSSSLIEATKRLSRRLGGARSAEIIRMIEGRDLKKAVQLCLHYYDSTYTWGLSKREEPVVIKSFTPAMVAQELLENNLEYAPL